jgi:hypothetical protein
MASINRKYSYESHEELVAFAKEYRREKRDRQDKYGSYVPIFIAG